VLYAEISLCLRFTQGQLQHLMLYDTKISMLAVAPLDTRDTDWSQPWAPHKNFSRDGQGLGDMASAEREPITGLWAEPLAGSRGRAPGQRGKTHWSWELWSICILYT